MKRAGRIRGTGTVLATGPQVAYLRRLLDQAFARRVTHGTGLDRNHLDRVSLVEASAAITKIKALLAATEQPATAVPS